MTKRYHGSCLCGQVTYSVAGFDSEASNCHCTMCRKFHGSAFGTLVPVTGLEWQNGLNLLKEYIADNGTIRTFCSNCGSSLGFRTKDTPFNNIELAIATFDENIPVRITSHIYTAYKANWCELNDNAAAYAKGKAVDYLQTEP